jgi:hypothetical protein
MPHDCNCAKEISKDLAMGKHLHGTADDYMSVQRASATHQEMHGKMGIGKVREGQTPAVLKKK